MAIMQGARFALEYRAWQHVASKSRGDVRVLQGATELGEVAVALVANHTARKRPVVSAKRLWIDVLDTL
jgi:hypothetical protein